jgi:hypothetical protein
MRKVRNEYRMLMGNPKRRDNFEKRPMRIRNDITETTVKETVTGDRKQVSERQLTKDSPAWS